MPNPTRTQIEKTIAFPTYTVQINTGSWVDISNYVISVNGSQSSTINQDNPLGFGDASESECTIVVSRDAPVSTWSLIPIRIYLGFESSNKLYYIGVIVGRSRDEDTITFKCGGFKEKIKNSTAYSRIFAGRLAATKTTASSVENPDAVGYVAGIINFILWSSGGRPLEQAGLYPTAEFYYSCDDALFRIKTAWVAGENIWDEALKVARASGGQLFQDTDGTVKYKNPLSYGNGTPIYTFTDSVFGSISEDNATAQLVGEVRCNYTPRYVGALQQVYQDNTPILLETGETKSITCETQWPLFQLVFDPTSIQLPGKEDVIQGALFDGTIAVNGTHFNVTVDKESAQRVVLQIINTAGQSMVIHKVTLYGLPLLADDQKSFVLNEDQEPQRILEDNVYVQDDAHAERLCRMVIDYYGDARPQVKLSGCGFDPDRYVGEIVLLTYANWSISAASYRIVDISHEDTGTTMDVTLVPISGLPTDTTFFIIGNTYSNGDVRQLSY